MESHSELQTIFEEYKHSEKIRKQKEQIHLALLGIYERFRSTSTSIKPAHFQSASSNFKSASSVPSSRFRTSSIILSGTDSTAVNNAPLKSRINTYKDYIHGMKQAKLNTNKKNFLKILADKTFVHQSDVYY